MQVPRTALGEIVAAIPDEISKVRLRRCGLLMHTKPPMTSSGVARRRPKSGWRGLETRSSAAEPREVATAREVGVGNEIVIGMEEGKMSGTDGLLSARMVNVGLCRTEHMARLMMDCFMVLAEWQTGKSGSERDMATVGNPIFHTLTRSSVSKEWQS